MKQSQTKSSLIILLAAILWGTTGSSQALAPEGVNPLVIGAMRMAVGGGSLFIFAVFSGAIKDYFSVDKKLLIVSALCMAFYQPLFFLGVSRTGIAIGTALALGSAPIFSGVIEIISGNSISKKWFISTSISVLGCILLFSGQSVVDMDIFGSLLSLGAGLSYAIYVKSSQKLFKKSNRILVNGLVFLTSAVILSPILFMNDLSWILSGRGAVINIHLGIIATALAYSLFAYGLIGTSTPRAVTLTLAEPLTATLLGVFVFGESFSVLSTIGALLLLCGLIGNTVLNDNTESSNSEVSIS